MKRFLATFKQKEIPSGFACHYVVAKTQHDGSTQFYFHLIGKNDYVGDENWTMNNGEFDQFKYSLLTTSDALCCVRKSEKEMAAYVTGSLMRAYGEGRVEIEEQHTSKFDYLIPAILAK